MSALENSRRSGSHHGGGAAPAARERKKMGLPRETATNVAEGHEVDGRRQRGRTSRALIVDAMLTLVREGDYSPSAAKVAELAGVSLRTVFRHFDDMETLYREMSEAIRSRVLPAFLKPYRSEDWRGRLFEMVERRIELFDQIMPFKISASVKRFQSAFLMEDYRQHLLLEQTSLESILPPEIVADAVLNNALRIATSFQGWRRLRHDQDLGFADSRAVVMRTVEALLAFSPDHSHAATPDTSK